MSRLSASSRSKPVFRKQANMFDESSDDDGISSVSKYS